MRLHHLTPSETPRRAALVAVALAGLLSLAACSGGDGSAERADTPTSASDDLGKVQAEHGVPAECRDSFMRFDQASLADVKLLPADWPEPPVPATLCQAESNSDATTGLLGYATTASPAEVTAAYKSALASYEIEDGSAPGQLIGHAGATTFSVTATEGVFHIAFAAD